MSKTSHGKKVMVYGDVEECGGKIFLATASKFIHIIAYIIFL